MFAIMWYTDKITGYQVRIVETQEQADDLLAKLAYLKITGTLLTFDAEHGAFVENI